MVNPSPEDKIKRQMERGKLSSIPKLPERIFFCGYILDEILANFPVVETVNFMHKDKPFYVLDINGKKITVVRPGMGPAAIQFAEEAYALGAREFLVYGSCGALLEDVPQDRFYLLADALAGDSCSSYYLGNEDPGQLIKPEKTMNEDLSEFLRSKNINFSKETTWTTFGFYMQTDELRRNAIRRGAICVDGEMAPMFAFANYRKVSCSALLFWSDITAPGRLYQYRTIKKGKPEFESIKKLGINLCHWLAR